jgi:heme-degrading monooxygenase HmoA
MFIRFRVTKGSEAAFEHVWLSRDTHLDKVPGFVEFHLAWTADREHLFDADLRMMGVIQGIGAGYEVE